jgi:signal transduction histidine kinase
MPLSEAARRLRNNKDRIIDLWEDRARKELPAGTFQDRPALIDSLPVFLEEIADTLEALENNTPERTDITVPKEHGEQRARLKNYSLDELLREYYILQEIMLGVLNEEGRLDEPDEKVVLDAMFRGIRESATEFARVTAERERASAEQMRSEEELREQFVVALAHDLRNPLTAARAGAQILMRNGDNADVRARVLARLNSSIDYCERMIRDMLDASQMRAGRPLKLELSEFDLCELVQETVVDLTTIHGARFVLICESQQTGVWSRPNLRRVLDNLLDNAVKYGWRQSPIKVTVRGEGDTVVIEIHNFGDPIPQHLREQIFKPFYTLARKDGVQQQGWGLGLPLVRGIVEAHGGRVDLRSFETEGTTFSIRLPRNASQHLNGQHVSEMSMKSDAT